jgi:hypothetical protein
METNLSTEPNLVGTVVPLEYHESSWEVKRGQSVRVTISPPSVSRFYRKFGIFGISKTQGTSWPVTRIVSFLML